MKKVATNLTFGQIFFILMAFFVSAGMFFYLGAKFGPGVIVFDRITEDAEPFLPDQQLAKEVKQILAASSHDFVFHDVLQENKSVSTFETAKSETKTPVAVPTLSDSVVIKNENDVPAVDRAMPTPMKSVPAAPILPPVVAAVPLAVVSVDPTRGIPPASPVLPKVIVQKEEKKVKESKNVELPLEPDQNDFAALAKSDLGPELPVTIAPTQLRFRLQIGSYSDKAKASKAVADWQKRGLSAQVITTNVPGKGVWYRLQLGSYESQELAQRAQQEIQSKYQQTPMVVSTK